MAWTGFRRDPIQEELRRITRESSRLGHTARRLLEETAVVDSGRHRPIQAVTPVPHVKRETHLLVENRMTRRKVILAGIIAAALAWILFRILASTPA